MVQIKPSISRGFPSTISSAPIDSRRTLKGKVQFNNLQQKSNMSTAGLNVDLDPFFELAELVVEIL